MIIALQVVGVMFACLFLAGIAVGSVIAMCSAADRAPRPGVTLPPDDDPDFLAYVKGIRR